MKTRLTQKLLGAVTLMGLLLWTSNGFARPPRQHLERGVILSVDRATSSFTLTSEKDAAKRTFVWTGSTSFRQKTPHADVSWVSRVFSLGEKTSAEALQPGQTVRFYYRKEVGRHVVRGVTIFAAADRGCDCCGQMATPPETHAL